MILKEHKKQKGKIGKVPIFAPVSFASGAWGEVERPLDAAAGDAPPEDGGAGASGAAGPPGLGGGKRGDLNLRP